MVKVKTDISGWIMKEHGIPNSRLTVIEQVDDYIAKDGSHYAQYRCICSCNEQNEIIALASNIRTGKTLSCGCLAKEVQFNSHKKYNKYDLSGEYGVGWTINTNNEFYFDLEDYDKIKDYCWSERVYSRNGYHSLETRDWKDNGKTLRMHYLLGLKYCDHIDRNPLNNQKHNLRNATIRENNINRSIQKNNTSGVIGVYWDKAREKWVANIAIGKNKSKYLGAFIKFEDAVLARLIAEKDNYGEFAPQKHLFKQYNI